MYLIFLIFLLAIGVASVDSTGNTCTNGNTVHPPSNSQPYYWPSTWNENKTGPALGPDQSCSWAFTIPQGSYAKLVMSSKTADNVSSFQIIDMGGNLIDVNHENKEPWYFPYPKFTLIISNVATSTLGFKVTWAKYPTGISYDQGVGSDAAVVNITKNVFTAEFGSVNSVSVLAFPADLKHYTSLRSTLIFEGNDFNGPFVNNLYELYKTHKQYVSSSSMIYVVNVEARNVLDKLVLQDSGYTKPLEPYHQLLCAAGSTCTKKLEGSKTSKSGLIYFGNSNQTLVDITMDKTATLSLYYGGLGSFFLYKTYDGSSIHSQLPLTLEGGGNYPVQYIISSGKSSFTFKLSN
ncbi:hypothetical protein CAEBREN_01892 [Caenorhabditis brenneri]|uniref:Uncharacterized protein n=1 Tax=Caenorhabditis brenneri TaxID=135651 RepID=G0NJE4_CAEBE|nr:hypothetical protein CAEBREN_01892 [Caenorhabditis brenneri]